MGNPSPTSDLDDQIVKEIINTDCQVLFAYTTRVYFQRLVNIFDLVRTRVPNITIAVGGPHATYTHEHTIRKTASIIGVRAKVRLLLFRLLN